MRPEGRWPPVFVRPTVSVVRRVWVGVPARFLPSAGEARSGVARRSCDRFGIWIVRRPSVMPQPSGFTLRPVAVGLAGVERRPVVCTFVGDVRRPVACTSPVAVRRPLVLMVFGAARRPPVPAAGDARRVSCPLLGDVRRSDVPPGPAV